MARCLGWRYRWGGEWSCIYTCQERWHPVNAYLSWVQVWEDE